MPSVKDLCDCHKSKRVAGISYICLSQELCYTCNTQGETQ